METLEFRQLLTADPVISEFMASNSLSLISQALNSAPDWLEIHNVDQSNPLDITGWWLSTSTKAPSSGKPGILKFQIPKKPDNTDTIIPANGYMVVFASNQTTGGYLAIPGGGYELHTNFNLSASADTVTLASPVPDPAHGLPATIVSTYTWATPAPAGGIGPQLTDISYGTIDGTTLIGPQAGANTFIPLDNSLGTTWTSRTFNDSSWISGTTGVGYKTDGSFNDVIGTNIQPRMDNKAIDAYVRIPFNVANPATLTGLDLTMQFQDGFVAYINGVEVARRNTPSTVAWNSAATKTVANAANGFPPIVDFDITSSLGALVAGTNVLAIQGLNDKINSPDFLINPQLSATTSTPGTGFLTTPTPGAPNKAGVTNFVSDLNFDHPDGFYTSPFDLTINTDTPGATIRYTTDGTAPTLTNGTTYNAPIHVGTIDAQNPRATTIVRAAAFKDGFQPTDVFTESYIFLNDVPTQSNSELNPVDFPSTWGSIPADYNVDQSVTTGSTYGPNFINDLKAVPTISLVMDPSDLFDPTTGIYSHSDQDGAGWTRGGSIEIINPDGSTSFQTNAAISMEGGASRLPGNTDKHSFRLFFNGDFGSPTKMNYKLFPDSSVDSFDTLILHASYNNTWMEDDPTQQPRADYIKDQFGHDSTQAMGIPSSHGTYVQLYINGVYWGLYNPLERPDASWAASYYGGNKDDWDVIHDQTLSDGDMTRWNAMFAIADDTSLTADQRYTQLKQYLDIPEFIDYMILMQYTGNTDWDKHNWYAGADRVGLANGDKTFKFWTWDSEHTLEGVTTNRIGEDNDFCPSRLFNAMIGSADFRQLFADHVQKAMFNNGPLTPAASIARYLARADQIDDAIVGESARWGDFRKTPGYTKVDWQAEVDRLTKGSNSWFAQRTNIMLNQYRTAGLFAGTNLDAPLFNQFGGTFSSGFNLSMTKSGTTVGTIYYTLSGADPRSPGGAKSGSAIAYSSSITLTGNVHVLARVYDGTNWSALTDATFLLNTRPQVRITEINYHPDSPAGSSFTDDDYEFLEVENIGPGSVNLLNYSITGGVNFTFPSMTLAAGQHAVVVSNLAAFQSLYGASVNVAGTFTGNLSNSDAELKLIGSVGETILDFFYNDSWYASTDGDGNTLVINNPADNPNNWGNPTAWHASYDDGGTPGDNELPLSQRGVVINEVLSNPSSGSSTGDEVELHNTSGNSIDINGWYLSDSRNTPKKYRINSDGGAVNTVIPAGGYLVLTELANFGNAGDPGALTPFGFNKLGDSVVLTSADSEGFTGYVDSHDFLAADVGVPFGLYTLSTDDTDLAAESASTFGSANAAPLVGPIVINEIMYDPAGTDDEFIELRNITGSDVNLFDPANPSNTWQFTDGIVFNFPTTHASPTPDTPNPVIPANGFALVVPIAPATFRSKYSVPANIPIFGPFTGKLDNSGEKVEISKPGEPQPDLSVPYIVVDHVQYLPTAPWPTSPAGTGPSLARVSSTSYGNDPVNWVAGPNKGTPGVDNSSTNQAPTVQAGASKVITLPTTSVTLSGSANDDGKPNPPGALTTTWSVFSGNAAEVSFGDIHALSTSATFSAPGVYVLQLTASDGTLSTSSNVQITVNQAPTADAGPDQYISFQQFSETSSQLAGTASDADALPNPPGGTTTSWTVFSSPDQGVVTFDDATSLTPNVSFSISGVYVLRLSVFDGDATTTSDVQIAIDQLPQVNAGQDDLITLPNQQYDLQGVVTDDGIPTGPGGAPTITSLWTVQSGPGTVQFDDETSPTATATFSAAGTYVLTLTATENSSTVSDDVLITVVSRPLTPVPVAFAPQAYTPFTGIVASFSDPNGIDTADQFSAIIDWGDGQTSPGQITANNSGGFDVTEAAGTPHVYTSEDSFDVDVIVNNVDGAGTIVDSTATVGDVPLTSQGVDINATAGAPFNGLVATFTDADPNGSLDQYSATIDWGDGGPTSTGSIVADNSVSGQFDVSGTHTYSSQGQRNVTITINDVGGASSIAGSTAAVAQPAQLVTNLGNTTGGTYDLKTAVVGAVAYTDRNFTISVLSNGLLNGILIRTPNDDKSNTTANAMSFTVTGAATVYVVYDGRGTKIPAWLSGFTLTGESMTIPGSTATPYKVYSKTFAASSVVTLGGNKQSPASGAASNYLVVVQPSTPVAPGQPQNFKAIAGNQQIALSWDPVSGATTYNLYRSLTTGTEGNTPYKTGLTGASYNDIGLTNGQNYYYVLTAVNSGLESQKSSESSAKPQASVGPLVTNLTTTTGQTYDLKTATVGAVAYTDRSFTISALTSNLLNGILIRTANNDKSITTANAMSFTLSGAAIVYVVYDGRATKLPAWLSGFTLTTESMTIPGSTTTAYKVYSKTFAANAVVTLGGNKQAPASGAGSNYLVVVQSSTPVAPPVPANFKAAAGNQQIALTWDASPGAATYNLYRSLTPGGEGAVAYKTGLTGMSFTDTGLTNGQHYYYTLTAVGSGLESLPSSEVNGIPQVPVGPLVSNLTTTTGKTYALSTAAVNAVAYTDRTFTISAITTNLVNGVLIQTANADKGVNTANAMSFKVNATATVYVVYDGRSTAIPSWLSGFTLTTESVTIPGSTATPYRVYSKVVAANTVVTLGGNKQSPAAGAASNYLVIVK